MPDQASLGLDMVRRFVELSRQLSFPYPLPDAEQFVHDLGYEPPTSQWRIFIIPELEPHGDLMVGKLRDEVADIKLDLTTWGGMHPSPGFVAFLDGVFASSASTITEMLGAPSERFRGRKPLLHWMLPNQGRIALYCNGTIVTLRIESPALIRLDGVKI